MSNARNISPRVGDVPSLHDGWTTLARLPALRRLLVDVPGSLLSSHSHRHSLPCPCLGCTRQPTRQLAWLWVVGFGLPLAQEAATAGQYVARDRRRGGRGRRRGRWWRRGAGGFGRWLDGFALAGARVVMVCASSNSPSKTGRCARSGVAAADLACPAGRSESERPARLPPYSPLEACRSAPRTRTPGKADISSENGKAKSSISQFHQDLKWMLGKLL